MSFKTLEGKIFVAHTDIFNTMYEVHADIHFNLRSLPGSSRVENTEYGKGFLFSHLI